MQVGRNHSSSTESRRGIRHTFQRLLVPSALAMVCLGASACLFGSSPKKAATPAQQASTSLAQGISAQNAGNNTTALNDYNAVLKLQPSNQYALYDLGTLYQLADNNCTSAADEYHKVLAINPNYVPALFNLAICETKTSVPEAIALYQQVITLSPKYAAAYLNLGYAQKSIGDNAEGTRNLNKAYKLDPSFKPATTTTTLPQTATGTT